MRNKKLRPSEAKSAVHHIWSGVCILRKEMGLSAILKLVAEAYRDPETMGRRLLTWKS